MKMSYLYATSLFGLWDDPWSFKSKKHIPICYFLLLFLSIDLFFLGKLENYELRFLTYKLALKCYILWFELFLLNISMGDEKEKGSLSVVG